jgi:hypothetical protein
MNYLINLFINFKMKVNWNLTNFLSVCENNARNVLIRYLSFLCFLLFIIIILGLFVLCISFLLLICGWIGINYGTGWGIALGVFFIITAMFLGELDG